MLRVGVVGLGFAGEQHLKGYTALDGVVPVAIAGLEPDRLASLRKTYGVQRTYDTYEPLVKSDDIDVVSVCVPNHLHAPVAIGALEAGKHVLCEKPLARTGDEAQRICDAAVANGRVLHVAFNHRCRGDVAELKRLVDKGALGRVYHAKASWMRRAGIPGTGTWFNNREMAGGGPLIDLGVHVLDMALYLLSEPRVTTVSAASYSELGPRGVGFSRAAKFTVGSAFEVEDMASAFMRLHDGGSLLLEASWATHSSAKDDFAITLYGTDGGAEIRVVQYNWEDTLTVFTTVDGEHVQTKPRLRRGDGHLKVVREFVEAVRDGRWSLHTGRDGLVRARLIDACYESALVGREVVVDERLLRT